MGVDKKKQGRSSVLGYIMMAIFFVTAAVLGVRLILMDILPEKYMIVYGLVVIAVEFLLWLSRRQAALCSVFSVVALLLSIGSIFVLLALNKLDNTVRNVTDLTAKETSQFSVLVLDSDPAQAVADLQNYQIGYVETTTDSLNQMKSTIAENGGMGNRYVGYDNAISVADALISGESNAVILNSAYIDMICDEAYEGFEDQVRVLFVFTIEEEADDSDLTSGNPLLAGSDGCFVIYISGIDTFGSVDVKSRSDVNILAVVNMKTHQVQLINTPRDYFVALPISGGQKDKLTHAGIYGVDVSIGAIEMLYDTKVDYYLRMNFTGFEEIIDAMGGIDVYSEYDFTVEPIKHYTVGYNHLSGIEALAFARERYSFGQGDIQRGINQMAVITAMIHKLTSTDVLFHYASILDSISGCFQTNFTSDEIYSLVKAQLKSGASWEIESYTVTGSGSSSTTYSMPGTYAYVMIPNDSDVAAAKEKIAAVINAE